MEVSHLKTFENLNRDSEDLLNLEITYGLWDDYIAWRATIFVADPDFGNELYHDDDEILPNRASLKGCT